MMQILTSKDLLKQQLEQAGSTLKKPKGVPLSKSTGIKYNASLQELVRAIKKDIDKNVIPLLKSLEPDYTADSINVNDSWVDSVIAVLDLVVKRWTSPEFAEIAAMIASKFVNTANDVNMKKFNEDFGNFGVDVLGNSPIITDYMKASIHDNTRLIKSISEQYLTQVESIVMTNVRAGNRSSAIVKSLSDQFGVSKNRAKMIARDQTAKVNANLAEKRQRQVGFEYYRWLDSGDSRVRDRHEHIADRVTAYGKGIYRWDTPPISDSGQPINPGEDFSCRCLAVPVFSAEVDKNKKEGKVNPSVKH